MLISNRFILLKMNFLILINLQKVGKKLQIQMKKTIVLFPDPFSVRTEYVLDGLDFAYPNTKIIGALASGGSKPGQNALFIDDATYLMVVPGLLISTVTLS